MVSKTSSSCAPKRSTASKQASTQNSQILTKVSPQNVTPRLLLLPNAKSYWYVPITQAAPSQANLKLSTAVDESAHKRELAACKHERTWKSKLRPPPIAFSSTTLDCIRRAGSRAQYAHRGDRARVLQQAVRPSRAFSGPRAPRAFEAGRGSRPTMCPRG